MKIKLPFLTIFLSELIIAAFMYFSMSTGFMNWTNVDLFSFSLKSLQNIITFNFVHSGYSHLIANLIILISAGVVIESKLDKKDFIILFFLGSAVSAVIFVLFSPEFAVLGSSAGSVSLLCAAIITNTKKTITGIVIVGIVGFAVFSAINFSLESKQNAIENQINILEEQKENAIQQGDIVKAEQTESEIKEKQQEQKIIKEGRSVSVSIPVGFEVHLFAALFGAFYMYFFRKQIVEKNAENLSKLMQTIKK